MKPRKRSSLAHYGLFFVVVLSLLLSACGGGAPPAPAEPNAAPEKSQPTTAAQQPAVAQTEESPAAPAAAAAGSTEGAPAAPTDTQAPAGEAPADASGSQGEPGTWTIMIYQNADDMVLERDIYLDLNEAEIVGSSDQVNIVSQIDRYKGAFEGGGDVTTAKRYLVTQDGDLENLASQEVQDLGEVDSSDGQTLIDFATWAIQTYPADKYVLILSDHGAGWLGGWSDNDPVQNGEMPTEIIDRALGTIIQNTGIGQFELVGFDACLMAQVEALSAVAPHARYAVASEETEPAMGWAYASFLDALENNTAMSGAELGQAIVDSYITQDYRVANDEARAVFLEEMGATRSASAQEVAQEFGKDITLTAVDLSRMGELNQALNGLAEALATADPSVAAAARSYAQQYTSVFGKEIEPSFIDLGNFSALASEQSGSPELAAADQAVQQAIQQAIVAEKHGDQRPGSTGFSIYFPNAQLYTLTFVDNAPGPYNQYVARFAAASLWDDFLTAYYTGGALDAASADLSVLAPNAVALDQEAVANASSNPAAGATAAAPTAGEITIQPLELSADEIALNGSVTINTTITGKNIAQVYIYSIYVDEQSGAQQTANIEYYGAENAKEVGGVTFPDWGESGEINISYDWAPVFYALSNGNEEENVFALFYPESYGKTFEEDVYTVYGVYTALGQEPLEAMIDFAGTGEMNALWVYSDANTGPRQVFPQAGDTFTVYDEWLEKDNTDFTYYAGGTITFGETPLLFQALPPLSGTYLVAVVVEDFDGNQTVQTAQVNVTP